MNESIAASDEQQPLLLQEGFQRDAFFVVWATTVIVCLIGFSTCFWKTFFRRDRLTPRLEEGRDFIFLEGDVHFMCTTAF